MIFVTVANDIIENHGVGEELYKIIPNTLSTCNCLHIALLVYLRLVSITNAFTYKKIHRQHRYKSIAIIWSISVLINIIPSVAIHFDSKVLQSVTRYIILYVFHICPIICIVMAYAKLIQTIKSRNRNQATATSRPYAKVNVNTKLSTKMIKGVAACLIICYVPYLAWWQYGMIVFPRWCSHPDGKKGITVYEAEVNMKNIILVFIFKILFKDIMGT